MSRRFFSVSTVLLFLTATWCGLPVGAQAPKKDETPKKEASKDDAAKEASQKNDVKDSAPNKDAPKTEEKKEEPKKEPFVADVPVKELKGHGDWINVLVISGDGKYLASASRDRTVKIWDMQTGQEISTLKGSPENIKGLIFLEKSAKVASSTGKWNKEKKAWEGEIKIWDIKAGKEVRVIKGHGDSIEGLAVSKDGKYLASASADQTVKIWELATGKDVQTLKGHTDAVEAVAFSSDGKKLATAGADKTVRIWDAATGENVTTFKAVPANPKLDAKATKESADTPKEDKEVKRRSQEGRAQGGGEKG